MTITREAHRQGPPRSVVILLALLVVGLVLELGAGIAMARHQGSTLDSGRPCSGRSNSLDCSTPAILNSQGGGR